MPSCSKAAHKHMFFFPPKSEGSGQVSSALQFLTRLVQT